MSEGERLQLSNGAALVLWPPRRQSTGTSSTPLPHRACARFPAPLLLEGTLCPGWAVLELVAEREPDAEGPLRGCVLQGRAPGECHPDSGVHVDAEDLRDNGSSQREEFGANFRASPLEVPFSQLFTSRDPPVAHESQLEPLVLPPQADLNAEAGAPLADASVAEVGDVAERAQEEEAVPGGGDTPEAFHEAVRPHLLEPDTPKRAPDVEVGFGGVLAVGHDTPGSVGAVDDHPVRALLDRAGLAVLALDGLGDDRGRRRRELAELLSHDLAGALIALPLDLLPALSPTTRGLLVPALRVQSLARQNRALARDAGADAAVRVGVAGPGHARPGDATLGRQTPGVVLARGLCRGRGRSEEVGEEYDDHERETNHGVSPMPAHCASKMGCNLNCNDFAQGNPWDLAVDHRNGHFNSFP